MLGVENHGALLGDQVLTIIRRIESPWVGVNLDTGNFFSDDPYGDLERCAPYAVNVQVKSSTRRRRRGPRTPTDYPRVARILRDANYQGFAVVEYEDGGDLSVRVPESLQRWRSATNESG